MARVKPNKGKYLASIANALYSRSTQVRDLIGNAHWLSDGRHKERLLGESLREHLPSGVAVASGFVVSSANPELCSREQDLLIVDTAVEAPLFHQGDLIITFPHTVLAAISVKTRFEKTEVEDSIQVLNTARRVA